MIFDLISQIQNDFNFLLFLMFEEDYERCDAKYQESSMLAEEKMRIWMTKTISLA
jgi:hypothetical protein